MFTLTPSADAAEESLADLVLRLISSMRLPHFDVVCREVGYDEWPDDKFKMPGDADKLYRALVFLSNDTGFFTLSCRNKALIIPFEGDTFNIVVGDDEKLPAIAGLDIKDSTDVLIKYVDAYEGMGLRTAFPE